MNHGVVLPIWQLTVAEAESLTVEAPKGSGRAAFQGSVAEVVSDLRRVEALGATWMTFDLPRAGVPAMQRAMERLAHEVKPAASA